MIRLFQFGVFVCAGVLAGCATPPAPVPQGDWVSVGACSMSSPAADAGGENLFQVGVRYQLVSGEAALLQVRPYCAGMLVPGHRAHVSIPVSAGAGKEAGWFSLPSGAAVDEVRASLVTLPYYRVLAEGRRAMVNSRGQE